MLENSLFAILALFLVGGSVGMLWSKQTILSAFGFLIAMLALAGVFALLENSFLFLAQIMVSVGAVVVLSLMVITSLNMQEENLPNEPRKLRWILLSALLITPFSLLMYKSLVYVHRSFESTKEGYGTLKMMGGELFDHWVLPFEIVSVLLLAAMVAAIVIARKEPDHDA
ncbi:MAG: NADH-quinone oxidoreductase subunit J [Campylobacterota bacterium]|nr:NADH-quinone oxidoreductase subunit J [Campylobacterota bacterium]